MYRQFVRNEPKEERSISGFEKQVAGHIYFHVQGEESELNSSDSEHKINSAVLRMQCWSQLVDFLTLPVFLDLALSGMQKPIK